MSGAGSGGMGEKIPKWEQKLWSYLSSSNDLHCPLAVSCDKRYEWCIGDHKEKIKHSLDDKRVKLSDYDFIKPTQLCNICYLVDLLARRLLKRAKINHPPTPVSLIQSIDDHRRVIIHRLALKSHHAALWQLEDRWIIQLRHNNAPGKNRFVLFHEAFHILSHCRSTPFFNKRGTEQGFFNELMADVFAALVLMPKEWMETKWAETRDLDNMSKIFEVPKLSMCVRLKRLGLI